MNVPTCLANRFVLAGQDLAEIFTRNNNNRSLAALLERARRLEVYRRLTAPKKGLVGTVGKI